MAGYFKDGNCVRGVQNSGKFWLAGDEETLGLFLVKLVSRLVG